MRFVRFYAIALLVFLTIASFDATADDARRGGFAEIADDLELSEDVRVRVREIFMNAWLDGRDRVLARSESIERLRALLTEAEVDRKAVREESARLSEIEGEIRQSRLDTLLDIREVLPADKRKQLMELQESRGEGVGSGIPEGCRADAEALCPGRKAGAGLRLCLLMQRDRVSDQCRAETRERLNR